MNTLKITIDGAQGSGKTTVSQIVAEVLAKKGLRVTVRDGDEIEYVEHAAGAVRTEVLVETRVNPESELRRLLGQRLSEGFHFLLESLEREVPDLVRAYTKAHVAGQTKEQRGTT
jgi:CO dehydrogenase nickel-insertion accessory protein CooC1